MGYTVKEQRKSKLLNKLESTVSKAVSETAYSAYLLSQKTADRFTVGKYTVIKKSSGLYDISEKSGYVLYKDLYCSDAVLAVVECLILNNMAAIRRILTAEHEYCKQYLNILHMKRALENKYSSVYEDRYELAKERLANAQYKIRSIRKTLR